MGILGFVISVINFIYFFVIRRKRLTIRFGDYGIRKYRNNFDLLTVHYQFENNSQLPLSITRVKIIIDNNKYDCDRKKHTAETNQVKRNAEVITLETKTDILPINLASLEARSGFLSFPIPQDSVSTADKVLNFEISTNRGIPFQKTFPLYEDIQVVGSR